MQLHVIFFEPSFWSFFPFSLESLLIFEPFNEIDFLLALEWWLDIKLSLDFMFGIFLEF